MSKNTDVAKVEPAAAVPAVQVPKLPNRFKDGFETFTSGMFLPRLQLEGSSSKLVKTRRIQSGNYALITGRDTFEDLGDVVDILLLDYRYKALDISDTKNIVASFDKASPVFQAIIAKSQQKAQGYLYGLEFLVYIPLAKNEQKFATLFMGNPTMRVAARNMKPLVGKPATLKSELIDNGTYQWDGPVILPCNTALHHYPTEEQMTVELHKFLNPVEGETPEMATEQEQEATSGRDR